MRKAKGMNSKRPARGPCRRSISRTLYALTAFSPATSENLIDNRKKSERRLYCEREEKTISLYARQYMPVLLLAWINITYFVVFRDNLLCLPYLAHLRLRGYTSRDNPKNWESSPRLKKKKTGTNSQRYTAEQLRNKRDIFLSLTQLFILLHETLSKIYGNVKVWKNRGSISFSRKVHRVCLSYTNQVQQIRFIS